MVKFTYVKGRSFEYQVRDFFLSKGFYVVRSAKSSFPDLIVISPNGEAFFIECKNWKVVPNDKIGLLSKEEYESAIKMIYDFKRPFFLFYKENHKMRAIAIGGKGITYLLALKPELVECQAKTSS